MEVHKTPSHQLSEVWGETVALRNLGLALLISCPTVVAGFLIARWLLESNMADKKLATTYSLLIGLFVTVCCGVICALLFKPQRIVTTGAAEDSTTFEETLQELAADEGGLGHVANLPVEVRNEMRDLELYDAFAHAESDAFAHAESRVPTASERRSS
jgi:hypothetical protein